MLEGSLKITGIALLALAGSLAAQQSALPPLPPDIPKDAVIRMFLTDKVPSGQDAVWSTPDGVTHEFFQFNDRGRGPKLYTAYRVDGNGLMASEETTGVDYMKTPVEERFSINSGAAAWKNQSEDLKQSDAAGKFYVDLDAGPESGVLLVRALLRSKSGKLALLPGGEASVRKLES